MTKRLLAIALVVLVAVSCVYLPSVVASAAEGDVFVANADEYNKSLVEVTFKVGQYRNDTVKVPAGAAADEAKLLTWAKDNLNTEIGLPVGETVSELVKVEGKENTYEVKTIKEVEVTFTGWVIGKGANTQIGDKIKVAAGTPVSEVLAKAPAVPVYPGKMFMNWTAFGQGALDNNGDGLVDDSSSSVTVSANYGVYTSGQKINFFQYGTTSVASQDDLNKALNGTADFAKYVPAYDPVVIPYGANPYDYLPAVSTAAWSQANLDTYTAEVKELTYNGKTYEFKSWRQIDAAADGMLRFVATYKEKAAAGTYTYVFDTNENGSNAEVTITSNTLTVVADDIINQDVKDAVAKYEKDNNKVFVKWNVATYEGNKVAFYAEYAPVYDYTYYYLDEAGFVTKSTIKQTNDASALLQKAPAVADGYTFTKWTLAGNRVINSVYVEGADDSELPAAKDGAASFKMAETLAADYFGEGVKATVGKTVSLKVTGASATFGEAVEDVNAAIDVNFVGINCDVESEGNAATVTLTGKGTAYVVATVSYQGDVYTKTFTVTGIK